MRSLVWQIALGIVLAAVLYLALLGPHEPRDVGVYTPPQVGLPDR